MERAPFINQGSMMMGVPGLTAELVPVPPEAESELVEQAASKELASTICAKRQLMDIIFPMQTLYITHPSCRLHDMGSWHPESPDRLDALVWALTDLVVEPSEKFRKPQMRPL